MDAKLLFGNLVLDNRSAALQVRLLGQTSVVSPKKPLDSVDDRKVLLTETPLACLSK